MEELQVAEALSAGRDVELSGADALTSCEDIQECCRGLVVWEKSSDTVTFLHQTVQQYLAKKVNARASTCRQYSRSVSDVPWIQGI